MTEFLHPTAGQRDPAGRPGGAQGGGADRGGVHRHNFSKPGRPKIDWDDPAAKDALVSVPRCSDRPRWDERRGADSALLPAQQVEHHAAHDVIGGRRPDHGPDAPGLRHLADGLVEFDAGPASQRFRA